MCDSCSFDSHAHHVYYVLLRVQACLLFLFLLNGGKSWMQEETGILVIEKFIFC